MARRRSHTSAHDAGDTQDDRAVRGGVVDHRFVRRSIIDKVRSGQLAPHDVCDAHPDLRRAAIAYGVPSRVRCPICERATTVRVTYVFGPRLPRSGKCVTKESELRALDVGRTVYSSYVVEVCRECWWHHLLRMVPLGGFVPRRKDSSEKRRTTTS
jgi:hypothetical protein